MRFAFRKIACSVLTTTLALLIGNVCDSAPPNKKQVMVMDLGAPGVSYSYFQETDELSPGTQQSVPWLGPKSEDAFLVVDTAALEANKWALEDPKTGSRISGYALFRTQTALRNPSEKRRTYSNLLGMLQALDINRDKRIDSSDFIYKVLWLYRDGNGDGKIDADELSSLEDEQIAEIGLIVYGPQKRDSQGNLYQIVKVKKQDDSKTEAQLVTLKSR